MTDASKERAPASASRMIFALGSALWLIVGSLALAFIVMVGTLACGAICGSMGLIWLMAAVLVLAMLVLAFALIVALIRRRLPGTLIQLTMIANVLLLLAAGGFALMLGVD